MKRGMASSGFMRGESRLRTAVLALMLPSLLAGPALAADRPVQKKKPVYFTSLTAPGSLGSFTPADPRFGALARGSEAGFRFTPSGRPGRRAVTIALRSRVVPNTAGARAQTLANASAYNLGVSVGWKRFTLAGEVARIDTGLAPFSRESADVGLSYAGRNWRTTLQVAADRPASDQLSLTTDSHYSVDLGGAYAISRNIALSGGLRYQLRRDRLLPVDNGQDSGSVYIGTAFRF